MLSFSAPSFCEASGYEVYADVWPESGHEGIVLVIQHDEVDVIVQLPRFRLSFILCIHLAVL